MSTTLVRALVVLAPTLILLAGSVALYGGHKTVPSLMQLVGAGCLVLVVLTHICEALNLLPFMRWGAEGSLGHYIDLSSAVLGITLFPVGYFLYALAKSST